MPSLHRDSGSPYFRVRFRYQGRNVNRSLKTRDRRKARAACDRVAEILGLLERGIVTVPPSVDPITYLLSDGRIEEHATQRKRLGLKDFFQAYEENLPAGSKEESTLRGERLHASHFQRHLGINRVVQSICKADLQGDPAPNPVPAGVRGIGFTFSL